MITQKIRTYYLPSLVFLLYLLKEHVVCPQDAIKTLKTQILQTQNDVDVKPQLRTLSQIDQPWLLADKYALPQEKIRSGTNEEIPSSMKGQQTPPRNVPASNMPPIICNCTPVHADPLYKFAVVSKKPF